MNTELVQSETDKFKDDIETSEKNSEKDTTGDSDPCTHEFEFEFDFDRDDEIESFHLCDRMSCAKRGSITIVNPVQISSYTCVKHLECWMVNLLTNLAHMKHVVLRNETMTSHPFQCKYVLHLCKKKMCHLELGESIFDVVVSGMGSSSFIKKFNKEFRLVPSLYDMTTFLMDCVMELRDEQQFQLHLSCTIAIPSRIRFVHARHDYVYNVYDHLQPFILEDKYMFIASMDPMDKIHTLFGNKWNIQERRYLSYRLTSPMIALHMT